MKRLFPFVLILLAGLSSELKAVSVGEASADTSPEAEQKSFTVHEDFEVNLFADETMGIANPVAMHWDSKGRLWVLTTLTYAQLEPGESPNDKLVVLEDTDHDGKADKSTVFIDGLNMPMGFALGYGGVYVGEGPDLLFFRDKDGDGKADVRKVVLTGFGTGDTHQNISNFTWGPDGCLYFSQGLHCYSRVETPWGIVKGNTAGFWKFDPVTLRLQPFCFPALASQNPCGITFDRDGAMFVKSNNRELIYVSPGLIPTTHQKNLEPVASIGVTPGKSMAAEYVESSHLPDWLQDHILVAGYYSNRVTAFPLKREGAGFSAVAPIEVLHATHGSFRPVEIKVGPEGAIYIADWFNPIIGHYQASLRHPDRDEKHGRVWRMVAKDRKLTERPPLEKDSDLWGALLSDERWARDHAFLELRSRLHAKDSKQAREFVRENLSVGEGTFQRWHALAAKPVILEKEGAEIPVFVREGLESKNWGDRCLTVKVFGSISKVYEMAVTDEHPRVRLEGIIAAANDTRPEAMKIALQALDSTRDQFIDYALGQAVFALSDQWVPAVRENRLDFEDPDHLVFALSALGGEEAVSIARSMMKDDSLPADARTGFAVVVASNGSSEDFRMILKSEGGNADILRAIADAAAKKKGGEVKNVAADLKPKLASSDPVLATQALRLAGIWQVNGLLDPVLAIVNNAEADPAMRAEAIRALAKLKYPEKVATLVSIVSDGSGPARQAALEALVILSPNQAAKAAIPILLNVENPEAAAPILSAFFSRNGASAGLAKFLKEGELSKEAAGHLATAMGRLGRSDEALLGTLQDKMGIATGTRAYSPDFVDELTTEVNESGNAEAGKEVYARVQLNCAACHQLKGVGGVIGPPLDAVGAGLPVNLLIESILWPDRQLKEGYFAIAVSTKDGETYSGYKEKEEDGVLHLKDTVSGQVREIPRVEIQKLDNIGTLMIPGLTNGLKREELRDLVAYLSTLKG